MIVRWESLLDIVRLKISFLEIWFVYHFKDLICLRKWTKNSLDGSLSFSGARPFRYHAAGFLKSGTNEYMNTNIGHLWFPNIATKIPLRKLKKWECLRHSSRNLRNLRIKVAYVTWQSVEGGLPNVEIRVELRRLWGRVSEMSSKKPWIADQKTSGRTINTLLKQTFSESI